ncbi:sensor histidine kinase, HAMP domain-containing [Desulfuromonas sp. DDH964]|uniref:sensor histidine kinase n=1 Tax=Desulfuromonas sp. DDH964 TaxID=1823759 RepID=UPI00078B43FB|nr:HAMP domain-containing sensor histidine kinase [Desulfuromonas sp. DDH964]AMV71789.1 sensor histidine kinase, HAMP domain-containing [Desulfuromonas sp. DDH964]
MSRKTGLRLEIILNIILLVGAALLLGSFLLLKMTEKELLAERVSRARSVVSLATGVASVPDYAGPGTSRLVSAEALLRRLGVDPALVSWQIVDSRLQEVAAFSAGGSPLGTSADLQLSRLEGEPLVRVRYQGLLLPFYSREPVDVTVTGGLFAAGKFIGALQVQFTLEDIRQRLVKTHQLVLLYVLCYGTVLVLFGFSLLERNVVRPVRSLMESTRQAAAGNLDQRLEATGPEEIAALADSFNEMLAALQESRNDLEQRNRLLQESNIALSQTRHDLIRSEKMASVGHLAAGMAHEIGNPLGAVVGYLEILKGEERSGRSREILGHALGEVGRIDRLVRDLLDYAAPPGGILEAVDLADLARGGLERLTLQHALRDVTLDTSALPQQLPPVHAAPHKLLQVVINLVLNAVDASTPGGVIQLSGGTSDGWVWLAVADQGCGMTAEEVSKIFDPFFTTKAPDKGRGLGLAVCHRILEEAGGTIDVESTPGQGSRFVLKLRAMEPEAS